MEELDVACESRRLYKRKKKGVAVISSRKNRRMRKENGLAG